LLVFKTDLCVIRAPVFPCRVGGGHSSYRCTLGIVSVRNLSTSTMRISVSPQLPPPEVPNGPHGRRTLGLGVGPVIEESTQPTASVARAAAVMAANIRRRVSRICCTRLLDVR
jgi:hypothetical protein